MADARGVAMPDDDTNHLEMLCAQFLPDFKAAQLRIAIARNMLRANDGILLGDESALQRAALWLARHAVNARFDELKREVGRHIKQRGSLLVEANRFLLHRGLGLPEIAGEYGVSACRKDRAKSHRNADWSENTIEAHKKLRDCLDSIEADFHAAHQRLLQIGGDAASR